MQLALLGYLKDRNTDRQKRELGDTIIREATLNT